MPHPSLCKGDQELKNASPRVVPPPPPFASSDVSRSSISFTSWSCTNAFARAGVTTNASARDHVTSYALVLDHVTAYAFALGNSACNASVRYSGTCSTDCPGGAYSRAADHAGEPGTVARLPLPHDCPGAGDDHPVIVHRRQRAPHSLGQQHVVRGPPV